MSKPPACLRLTVSLAAVDDDARPVHEAEAQIFLKGPQIIAAGPSRNKFDVEEDISEIEVSARRKFREAYRDLLATMVKGAAA